MKTFGVLLLACACLSPVYGQAAKADAAEAVKQLERDWLAASKAGDAAKLGQIVADDWEGLGFDGVKATKSEMLANLKSGAAKLESYEVGPMDVKVFGNVAVVQGSDKEKSSFKGKDTSGKWVWMDVFVQRDGKWQAVRSQSAWIK
jgi:hypothetical protein